MTEENADKAFEFHGTWQEYAPIAFTNLLLTIVTLGFYRFWATARTRRYLWSRTRFIDDRFEWAGTGLELFKGAVMVFFVIGLPLIAFNFLIQRLVLNGDGLTAGVLGLAFFLLVYWLVGVARFRALRYRLARTYWRGIRGGSDDPGMAYGVSYMWKNFVGTIALGLLIPWSMVSLWNERWGAMSFGPYKFAADGRVEGLMGRFLLCYAAPFLALIAAAVVVVPIAMAGGGSGGPGSAGSVLAGIGAVFGFYFIFGLVVLAFYAKFFRQMVESTSLSTLSFGFTASTKDWLKLFLGDVALVVLTLGVGAIFLTYRHWSFGVRHLHAFGYVEVDHLTQSTTKELREGEGLLDAFDMGAI
ncbi:MAG: hypothetical protein RL339_2793 [Pseudomonadota bacterium]|jgi:uncharacterized membrane protein YjgN (DUF898 family)